MNLLEYWKEASAVIIFIIGVFSGRKSKDFKEKTEGAGAIAALQNIYDTYIEHSKKVTEDLIDRVKALEKHNRDLQKNFNDISFSYSTVMGENRKIEAQYKELQKDYESLKVAHEKLQKEFNDYKSKIKLVK
jgi:chromosome segregation ATPase